MYLAHFTFSSNMDAAAEHIAGHEDWVRKSAEDGYILLVGRTQPEPGGVLLAAGISLEDLQARLAEDPFVAHDVVAVKITEIAPQLTDPRLAFLMESTD